MCTVVSHGKRETVFGLKFARFIKEHYNFIHIDFVTAYQTRCPEAGVNTHIRRFTRACIFV